MERYYEMLVATDLEAVTDDIFSVTAKFHGIPWNVALYQHVIFEDMTAVTTGFDSMDISLKVWTAGFGLYHLVKS